ncbi:unnamed protein product [Rotaria magnacalcarata]
MKFENHHFIIDGKNMLIFGNDCVFFNLTQDTTSKISSGRSLAKGQAPLIMHLYNENSSLESQTTSIATCHRYKPC